MKKHVLTSLACLLLIASHAQTVTQTTFTVDGQDQPAYLITLNYPVATVEEVLENYFKKDLGMKGNEKRDLHTYKGVKVKDISSDKTDVYWTAVRKSRKEKDKTDLYILVSKGYDNFISSTTDSYMADRVKKWVTGFKTMTHQYTLHTTISNQEQRLKELQEQQEATEKEMAVLRQEMKKAKEQLEQLKTGS